MYNGKTAFVAHITLIRGVPFYGYHVGYKFFLKVYMLNPLHMTRLADLLRQGTIMKKFIQPYESHMQYILQWMCDYNLYGCAYIDCRQVKFREPIPDFLNTTSSTHQWHDRTIPPSFITSADTLPRQSHCSIEVDVHVQHILNRLDIKARPLHHDFIERNIANAPDEKLVHSMAGLWRDETRRRKLQMGNAHPGSSPFPPDVLVSVSADPRNSQPGGWIHEEEYMEKIVEIIKEEKDGNDGQNVSFDTFVEKTPFEEWVKTVLESVEDLFPENLESWAASHKAAKSNSVSLDAPEDQEAEVDESRVLSIGEHDFPYESDEDIAREMEGSQAKLRNGVQHQVGDTENPDADTNPATRPGGDGFVEQFSESLDPAPFGQAQDPTNSMELRALGIRDAGDYSQIEGDAFEIPSEYVSDITITARRQAMERERNQNSEPSRKRHKSAHIGRSSSIETFKNRLQTRPDMRTNHAVASGTLEGTSGSVRSGLKTSPSSPSRGDVTIQRQEVWQGKSPLPGSYPQDRSKINSTGGNEILSFPVVKYPQVSNSVSKLSQQSNSPLKDIQVSKVRIASFDTSKERDSGSSSNAISLSNEPVSPPSLPSTQVLKVASRLHHEYNISAREDVLCFLQAPPTALDISQDLSKLKVPAIIYQDAYYSDETDVPERAREYAGKEFKLESTTVPYLPDFDPTGTSIATWGAKPSIVVDKIAEEKLYQQQRRACSLRTWEIDERPPTKLDVQLWLEDEIDVVKNNEITDTHLSTSKENLSQIEGATQKNHHGFKYSQKQKSTSVQHETQYMSIMSLEIHVNTRGNLVPNPEKDEIGCVFWCVQSDDEDLKVNGFNEGTHVGILVLSEVGQLSHRIAQQTAVEVEEENNELDLINRMVDIVRYYDPDILTGYEVHGGSWGYMIERARCKYDYNLCDEFSRMKSQSHGRFGKEDDRWGFNHTSTIRVTGRHMINIWRAMRGELNLLQYTMENVVFHLLHRRIPHFPFSDLTSWYCSSKPRDLSKVLDYYITRVQLDLEILEQNELIPRTSEQARLLGVDFFSVFSRGSQFKVESLMFRIAKPENFLLPSPSRKQVGQQNALECLPLVMEPQSAFYNSPLLVLDFQSLYPSVMIAYNYCYSTFLGRVVSWRGQNKMGFTDYQRERRLLELFQGKINIAPNGIMFAKPEIRKSLLAKMLGEILETRVMVKSGMKVDKDDKTLQRLLNNRQLALKLIANVTYGYTSASFSGRMPSSEIADSIVQTGRETLEKAIALIHSVGKWGAEVVYGDTDSLFVYLEGRTKDEAFDIGNDIAKTITDMNPRPVKLKFEKVYFPCVLLAKKRYVGFKYESRNQKEPEFDAKGIETVRRDGTPAEQKIEEKALKILFRTADLSQVKSYFQRECTKIMKGKVSIQDFCFAREVKLGTYSDRGPPPPGALISTRRMLEDPRAEPQYGERVPYVVITGTPGARLIDRCVAPDVLLHDEHNELDAEYYISKNLIPPLERIFNLVGANVRQWYDEMPKFQRIRRIEAGALPTGKDLAISKKTLESYMKSSSCLVCREKLEEEIAICGKCMRQVDSSLLKLRTKLNKADRKAIDLEKVCRSCASLSWGEEVRCDSKDCPVFYSRARHLASLRNSKTATVPIIGVLEGLENDRLTW